MMQDDPKKQAFYLAAPGFINHAGLDGQILPDEIGRISVVGGDTADACRRRDTNSGLFSLTRKNSAYLSKS